MKPKKWMPKVDEKYWYIAYHMLCVDFVPRRRDETKYYKYNCFKTKKLALEAARKIREVLG